MQDKLYYGFEDLYIQNTQEHYIILKYSNLLLTSQNMSEGIINIDRTSIRFMKIDDKIIAKQFIEGRQRDHCTFDLLTGRQTPLYYKTEFDTDFDIKYEDDNHLICMYGMMTFYNFIGDVLRAYLELDEEENDVPFKNIIKKRLTFRFRGENDNENK